MLRNRWNLTLDDKRRFNLPSGMDRRGYTKKVFLAKGKVVLDYWDGCVEIFPWSRRAYKIHCEEQVYMPVDVERRGRKGAELRIQIPGEFKNSVSFYCGREITLVREKDRLVVYPGKLPVI